jgi:hypothetical protein
MRRGAVDETTVMVRVGNRLAVAGGLVGAVGDDRGAPVGQDARSLGIHVGLDHVEVRGQVELVVVGRG